MNLRAFRQNGTVSLTDLSLLAITFPYFEVYKNCPEVYNSQLHIAILLKFSCSSFSVWPFIPVWPFISSTALYFQYGPSFPLWALHFHYGPCISSTALHCQYGPSLPVWPFISSMALQLMFRTLHLSSVTRKSFHFLVKILPQAM